MYEPENCTWLVTTFFSLATWPSLGFTPYSQDPWEPLLYRGWEVVRRRVEVPDGKLVSYHPLSGSHRGQLCRVIVTHIRCVFLPALGPAVQPPTPAQPSLASRRSPCRPPSDMPPMGWRQRQHQFCMAATAIRTQLLLIASLAHLWPWCARRDSSAGMAAWRLGCYLGRSHSRRCSSKCCCHRRSSCRRRSSSSSRRTSNSRTISRRTGQTVAQ